jgi:hypothetical protein
MQCGKKFSAYRIPQFLSRNWHSNMSEKHAVLVLNCDHSSLGENGTPDHGRHKNAELNNSSSW